MRLYSNIGRKTGLFWSSFGGDSICHWRAVTKPALTTGVWSISRKQLRDYQHCSGLLGDTGNAAARFDLTLHSALPSIYILTKLTPSKN